MNRFKHCLSEKTEGDLQKLVEPLAGYIACIKRQNVGLRVALLLLLQHLEEVNELANNSVDSFSERHIG